MFYVYWIYFWETEDIYNSGYVGITDNLKDRFYKHRKKFVRQPARRDAHADRGLQARDHPVANPDQRDQAQLGGHRGRSAGASPPSHGDVD